jgi:hypothetical protein
MTRRKSLAHREPSGKVRRPARADPTLPSPTEVTRLRDAALAGMRDAVWSSPLGWLYLSGRLSGSQFAAGKKWATLARDYSAACQAPKTPRSANLEPGGGQPPDPDSERGRREAQQHAHTLHQYIAALATLNVSGTPARKAVEAICEQGQMPAGHHQLASLVVGLTVLSIYWSKPRR